ncbi:MAG: response regulator [Chloroflexota bacterium]
MLQLKPDLIILDLNLGQVEAGWSFLQLIKMEPATAAIPIIVCTTANPLAREIEGYLVSRQIRIVRNPFDVQTFLLAIRKILMAEPLLPILVVDDNEGHTDAVTTMLELEGFEAATAPNGQLALDAMTLTHYALILTDISMPVMAGFEFLVAYAQQPGIHSPVIIVSAEVEIPTESLPEFVVKIIRKPFDLRQLLAVVREYVQPILPKSGF